MKIGLLTETKFPVDNRVALSPKECTELINRFPGTEVVVQSSNVRAFSDNEYQKEGIPIVKDVSDCDILFGIKEANIDTLIPNKKYVFFGHFAKEQVYNKGLLKALIKKGITFYDYEYMVDDTGNRVCAFGWWAGVVGVYYSLRGYGLKTGLYQLPPPDNKFTLDKLKNNLKSISLPNIKIVLTGGGRVSKGAQDILKEIGAQYLSIDRYLKTDKVNYLTYTVALHADLVTAIDGFSAFSLDSFSQHPEKYKSNFDRFAKTSDLLICCHFWAPNNPVYLSTESFLDKSFRIKLIGDVTCDIMGSVKSTLRSSTHSDPYYDYNPITQREDPAFLSDKNITVMAVDTCPNALPIDTSDYFGRMLIQHVFPCFLSKEGHQLVIDGAMILKDGALTPKFEYLNSFANS